MWSWSAYQGLVKYNSKENNIHTATGEEKGTNNPQKALARITEMEIKSTERGLCFVLKDFHGALVEPVLRQIRDMYTHLVDEGKTLIIVSPVIAHGVHGQKEGLPPTLEKQICVVNYSLPSQSIIRSVIEKNLEDMREAAGEKPSKHKLDYTEQEMTEFSRALQGLTTEEVETASASSIAHLQELSVDKLIQDKRQIIRKSQILEFIDEPIGIKDVGGLDQAKTYLVRYVKANTKEAKEYGVEPLKGILLTGIPGTGKSLLAKAIGKMWKLPLLRLDVGRVMTGLVGGSIRGAEEVIWQDENGNTYRNTIEELVTLAPNNCMMHTYTDSGAYQLQRVVDFIPHKLSDTDKLYRLTMEDGRSIVTTGDHGVLTHTDDLLLKEVRVDALQNGDFLAMPGNLEPNHTLYDENDWDNGFLAGAWLGDGDYNGRDVRYHLSNKDIPAFEELLNVNNFSYSVYDNSSSNNAKVIHVRGLQDRLQAMGFTGNSHTKRVPAVVFGKSYGYITGLLCGYFSTDGSFTNHVVEASSVSKLLRDDIAHLLHYVGIHAFIAEKTSCNGKRTIEGTDYIVRISAETDLRKFVQEVGFIQDYKSEAIANRKPTSAHGYYVPLTQAIKDEINAMRRRMWKQMHRRPYGFDHRANAVGLETIVNCYNFAQDSLYSGKDYPSDDFGHTLNRASIQNIRWIKVKSIKEVSRLPNEDTVYDLSIPGTGTEKFIAGSCPLLVHNSEGKMRDVIHQAESMAPCILWIDEVEKSLSGTKSSNFSDGGTLARVFGTLLTAMQDGMEGVTIVATANDITMLPPEFIRRFNEVFFVDLPGPEERWEIFDIHLSKRGRNIKNFEKFKETLLDTSKDYTGAEIEKAVKDAVAAAFEADKKNISHKDLINALQDTKPISKVMADKIKKIRNRARGQYRYASTWSSQQQLSNKVGTESGKTLDIDNACDDLDEFVKGTKKKQKKRERFKELEEE
jgi:SpoVK/Ycf46/Vps4 family AAA+-type ATPase